MSNDPWPGYRGNHPTDPAPFDAPGPVDVADELEPLRYRVGELADAAKSVRDAAPGTPAFSEASQEFQEVCARFLQWLTDMRDGR